MQTFLEQILLLSIPGIVLVYTGIGSSSSRGSEYDAGAQRFRITFGGLGDILLLLSDVLRMRVQFSPLLLLCVCPVVMIESAASE